MVQNVAYKPTLEAVALYTRFLGHPLSVEQLERAGENAGESTEPARAVEQLDQQTLINLLDRCGFDAKIINLPAAQIDNALLPALGLFNHGHWRLLTALNETEVVALTPESGGGEDKISRADFDSSYAGQALITRPKHRSNQWTGSFISTRDRHWFWGTLRPYWASFVEVGIAAFVANALAIAIALFAMQVYDRVIPSSAFDTLWVLASGVFIAIVLESLIRMLRMNLLEHAGKSIDHQLGRRLFEQSIRLRLVNRPATAGVMATQIREFESVRDFFTATSAALVSDLPFVFLFLGIIALLGGGIVWVPVAAIGLLLLPGMILQPWLSRLSKEGLQESAFKNSLLLESFEGLESIKAASGERRLIHLWGELHDSLSETNYRSRRATQMLAQWSSTVQQLTYVSVIITGAYLIDAGALSVGGLVASTILVSRTIAPMGQVGGIMSRWQHVKAALNSLDGLMKSPTERPPDRHFVERPDIRGHYRLEEVRWRHTEESPAVLDISALMINPGERIAILGSSGAGKSSLLRLLSGLVSPNEGQILLDDTNLDHIDPVDRNRHVAYLPQDVMLFNGTLRDNINPARLAVSDAVLIELLTAIGLGDFVRSLPVGLDTVVQSNRSLSGGQRQLIGIARVLTRDPSVLILDEPTSSLDQKTENLILSYLQRWLHSRTLIVATHKRSLLDITDRVMVMRQGRVVMDGPRQQVAPSGVQAITPGQGGV